MNRIVRVVKKVKAQTWVFVVRVRWLAGNCPAGAELLQTESFSLASFKSGCRAAKHGPQVLWEQKVRANE